MLSSERREQQITDLKYILSEHEREEDGREEEEEEVEILIEDWLLKVRTYVRAYILDFFLYSVNCQTM